MATPRKRDDSTVYQFVKRVPADVLAKARGTGMMVELPAVGTLPALPIALTIGPLIKFSLHCREPDAAKVRHGHAAAHVGQVFDSIRRGPRSLSHKEAVALSGDVYRHVVELNEDDPGSVDNWAAVKAYNRAVREGRISAPPSLRPSERHGNEVELARALFGADLTGGINQHPPGDEDRSAFLPDGC